MTTQEIQTALLKYAKSDVNAAQKRGEIAICGTKQGNISLTFENGSFQAFGFNTGETLTQALAKKEMILWVSNQYQVEL